MQHTRQCYIVGYVVILAKTKLNTFEVLISKVLIGSFTNHDNFFSVNNVLRQFVLIVSVVRKILRKKIPVNEELNKTD